jgi:hypothetical protein
LLFPSNEREGSGSFMKIQVARKEMKGYLKELGIVR